MNKEEFFDLDRLISLPIPGDNALIAEIQAMKGYLVAFKYEQEQLIEYLETEIKDYEERLSLIKGQVLFIEDVFRIKLEILRIILNKVRSGKYD